MTGFHFLSMTIDVTVYVEQFRCVSLDSLQHSALRKLFQEYRLDKCSINLWRHGVENWSVTLWGKRAKFSINQSININNFTALSMFKFLNVKLFH